RLADVGKLTVSITKVRPFIVAEDWRPVLLTDRTDLQSLIAPAARLKVQPAQMELFG
ncbi:MAG: biotin synthase, partial [Novosphingobium sp.]|nr:biotin synthase [Novosphingobium sp.]